MRRRWQTRLPFWKAALVLLPLLCGCSRGANSLGLGKKQTPATAAPAEYLGFDRNDYPGNHHR